MYQLVRQTDYKDFNMVVNNFLKDGWSLYGQTMILKEGQNNIIVYYQTLTKS